MDRSNNLVRDKFGGKLRVRVCGICIVRDKILLVNHLGLNEENEFWAPPGGGMDFGLSAEENLKREFKEETGLDIGIKKFLFVHEFVDAPLHAVELFFDVEIIGGDLLVGTDPELCKTDQIIFQIDYKDFKWINRHRGNKLHQLLNHVKNLDELTNLEGYFKL